MLELTNNIIQKLKKRNNSIFDIVEKNIFMGIENVHLTSVRV